MGDYLTYSIHVLVHAIALARADIIVCVCVCRAVGILFSHECQRWEILVSKMPSVIS